MTKADSALIDEVDKLRTLPVADLRARYLELFGDQIMNATALRARGGPWG